MVNCLRISENLLRLDIKALPGAGKSQILGIQEGRLRVRIASVPRDGRANEELRAFLAKLLGCPKRDILLHSGEKSRLKTICLPLSLREKLEKIIREQSPGNDTPRI
jgi:uncharacterized protein (TIGR00251 family)